MQEPGSDQFANRPLDYVVLLEVGGRGIEDPSDLGDRQLTWMLVDQEREDGAFCLARFSDAVGGSELAAIPRVAISHEEHSLLVVRRPVVFTARRVAAF
jgi:hypothetical protein